MALNYDDQRRVREFLLGKLSEDEQQKIEERMMVEDDLFEELEISKGELVEEYCANELSREEHQWFEQNFLASPEGKERYDLAVTLGQLTVAAPQPRRLTFFEKLQNLFKQHPSFIAMASTAAIVVVVAAIFVFRPRGETVVGPTLASTIINREQGSLPAKITIPSNASEIKFPLSVSDDVSGASYRAELDNQTEIKPAKVAGHDGKTVWVVIPVSQLPRGQYSLKLLAITPDGKEREIPGDYRFDVE